MFLHVQLQRYTTLSFSLLLLYSGTSLLRSPTGLGKSDLNTEVAIITGASIILVSTTGNYLCLRTGDLNTEAILLLR